MNSFLKRRDFLKLAGLAGVAGAVGCGTSHPTEELVSIITASGQAIPGIETWFATTCQECPAGCGMKVRTREGRVTKVEGNPDHPISRGGLCIRGQASVQGLYNPDRFRGPFRRSANGAAEPIKWAEGISEIAQRLRTIRDSGGENKVAFLSGHTGPTMDRLIRECMRALHSNRYITFEPFSFAAIAEANRITFGVKSVPHLDIANVDYLLSFGADFLETWLSPVGLARDFAATRRIREGSVGKFVHIEPRLSMTAANADEWLAIRPGGEMSLALGMARHILEQRLGATLSPSESQRLRALLEPWPIARVSAATDIPEAMVQRLASEFARSKSGLAIGGGVAVAGENATATQVAIQLLNYVTGRIGKTVRFDQAYLPPEVAGLDVLRSLVDSMNRGEIELLFIHHANPAFSLPPALGFGAALRKVPMVVSFANVPDETTEMAHLVLPDHMPLEQWGDARPSTGAHSLMQPAMNPVFDTRAAGDVLLELSAQIGSLDTPRSPAQTFFEYLKNNWKDLYDARAGKDFEEFWREALLRGELLRGELLRGELVPGGVWDLPAASENDSGMVRAAKLTLSPALFSFRFPAAAPESGTEIFLHTYPSSRHYDGRGANRPWLHEIPDPITNVVWDSWVEVHPETAGKLGVIEGDLLHVESSAGTVEAPVYVYAGIRPDTVAIPIGLGHESFGRYASGRGVNPARLLPATSDAHSGSLAWAGVTVKLSKTGRRAPLVRTDGSTTDHERGLSKIIPLSALTGAAAPRPNAEQPRPPAEAELPSMYPPHEHKDYRWGMAINLSSCTGCNACVAACYAENNIPIVGKERIAQGRHMAWIRIERYMENISSRPDIRFSPMMCQQCDNAPCEPVCPVHATMHSSDGLNVQVYNRCVGTRYCSNNCPYKVRVFNWFDYELPDPLPLPLNPDVSVRGRGIMEKCTFCVQRIRAGKDHAKDEGRKVRDGEVVPACAQSCPTQAIVFGNLLDSESAVSRLSSSQHGYKVLEELNTRPAITYLPRIKRA